MSGFLLDTNVVSELIKPEPSVHVVEWIDSINESLSYLSVLTLGEIRAGVARLRASARRARLESWLDVELRDRFQGRILTVDAAVADRWGTITALTTLRGRPVPVTDALLAATALVHGLTMVTRNVADFELTGVVALNPWE